MNVEQQLRGAGRDIAEEAAARAVGFIGTDEAGWTGDRLVVIATETPSGPSALAYDPVADLWEVLPDPPLHESTDASVGWAAGLVWVWGADYINRRLPAQFVSLDPAAGQWTAHDAGPLSVRWGQAGTGADDRFVVWGGFDDNRALADGAIFDPASEAWTMLPDAPIAGRTGHALVWTADEVAVIGGAEPGEGPYEGVFYDPVADARYDPAEQRWRQVPLHLPQWVGSRVTWSGPGTALTQTLPPLPVAFQCPLRIAAVGDDLFASAAYTGQECGGGQIWRLQA